jgi:hypothetical protein
MQFAGEMVLEGGFLRALLFYADIHHYTNVPFSSVVPLRRAVGSLGQPVLVTPSVATWATYLA